jgi:hypothetical protein
MAARFDSAPEHFTPAHSGARRWEIDMDYYKANPVGAERLTGPLAPVTGHVEITKDGGIVFDQVAHDFMRGLGAESDGYLDESIRVWVDGVPWLAFWAGQR